MTHEQKVAAFEKQLRDRGYWISNAIPPACRLLWRMGFKVPPPCFLPFPVAALSAGIAFALIYAIFMWLFVWPANITPQGALISATAAGVLYGLAMAAFWHIRAKQLDLPPWKDFPREKPNS